MRPPVCERLVVTTEHSYGDLLPEPGSATRPEPIDVIAKGCGTAKLAMVRSRVIVATAERSKYLHGGEDGAVLLVCEGGGNLAIFFLNLALSVAASVSPRFFSAAAIAAAQL